MSDKQTYCLPNWEDLDQFPDIVIWITKENNSQHFLCKICESGSLKMSNMGIGAL